jgi:hypothetical protein
MSGITPTRCHDTTNRGGEGGGTATPLTETRHQSNTPPLKKLDVDHDGYAPLRFRALTNILGPESPLG